MPKKRLQKQSEWLRITLASIGDAVISTDAEGRVTFLNGVAEALTGWSQAEAVGQPLAGRLPHRQRTTRLPVENPALRALREGTVVGLANHTILIARDGTERRSTTAPPMRTGRDMVGRSWSSATSPSKRARRSGLWRPSSSHPRTRSSARRSRGLSARGIGAERLFGYRDEAVGQPIT